MNKRMTRRNYAQIINTNVNNFVKSQKKMNNKNGIKNEIRKNYD